MHRYTCLEADCAILKEIYEDLTFNKVEKIKNLPVTKTKLINIYM